MNKKSLIKTLKNKCEKLWKEVCRLRDGEQCQGINFFDHQCGGYLQVDHCFSRTVGALFLDPRNGTTICRDFHCLKTNKQKGAEKAVDEWVKLREGQEFWDHAVRIAKSKTPYIWNIIELEQILIKLKEMKAELLSGGKF